MDNEKLNVSLLDQKKILEEQKQTLHEKQMELSHLNIMNKELENEIQKMHNEYKEKNEEINKQESDIKKMYLSKVNSLQALHDKEMEDSKQIISELEEKIKNFNSKEQTRNYKEDFQITIDQIKNIKEEIAKLRKDLSSVRSALELCESEKSISLGRVKVATSDLSEMKEMVKSKAELLKSTKEDLEELQGEKALLSSELNALKVGPIGNIQRGNSLFAEVDDKRLQVTEKLESMKNKYTQSKKKLALKDVENEKLKAENNRLLSCWNDENSGILTNEKFSKLLGTYQKRIDDLVSLANSLKLRQESPQIITVSDKDLTQLQWIHAVVNSARDEANKLRAELDEKSTQSLSDANQLCVIQQDLRKLKARSMKDKALINELKMQMESFKKESSEKDKDGVEAIKENSQHHPKGIRFADDVKKEDTDTRKKCSKRIPKPQSYPKIFISSNSSTPLQVIQEPKVGIPK